MKFRILEYKPAAAGRRIGVEDVIFDDELIVRGIAIVAGKDGGPPMALLPLLPLTSFAKIATAIR